ncbi:MAG: hypothetical protein H7123_02335, partial [Thermoleophilia bacterium]|nr:hypothetical protein [Thermoleophilia bacterium]
ATAQIDTTAPTASIDPVPTGSINSNVDFVGDLYDNGSGLVNPQWSVSSGGPSTPMTNCTFPAGATRYVCHWDTTGLSAGHYTLALHAVDGLAHATDAPAAGIDLS